MAEIKEASGEMTSQNLRSGYNRHFWGYNLTQRVELMGEDVPCYSNKIQSVSLRKCPRDHQPVYKAYI